MHLSAPLRNTKQREVILEELSKVTSHPTADELYEMVRKRLPNISLGTVYRNLELLSESGAIQKLDLSGTQKRFDANTENHYHFRCKGCGRVDDVPGEPIPIIDRYVTEMRDYQVDSHRVEFTGFCPECRMRMQEQELRTG